MTLPRDRNDRVQESFEWSFPHGSVSASTTWKVRKPKRDFVIDGVAYHNVTGLAEDASNSFAGAVKIGATTAFALFNTDSDLEPDTGAAIAADTWIDGVPSEVAGALNGAAGAEVTLVATKTGTQTLPAGQVVIRGRYL